MLSNKRKCFFILPAIILVIAASLVLVVFTQSTNNTQDRTSTKIHVLPDDVEPVIISGSIVGYDMKELIKQSTLVAYGTIEKIDDAKKINGVSGGAWVVTDTTFKIKSILRGEEKDTVTVRFLGGLYHNVYEEYEEIPEMKLNEEYLLFLYQPGMGGGMNTEGDYYYPAGLYQGVFNRIETDRNQQQLTEMKGISADSDILFANANVVGEDDKLAKGPYRVFTAESFQKKDEVYPTNVVLSLETLKSSFTDFNKQIPVQYNLFREETEDAYKTNLENGFITEEEYETFMAALDQYATFGEKEINPDEESRIAAEKQKLYDALEENDKAYQE